MKTRRTRFLAVQTLLTVVLVGVIVVTLISPENENTLFAVDVPSATSPAAGGPPSPEAAENGDQDGGNGRGGGDGAGSAGAGATAFAPAPGAAGGAVPAPALIQPPAPDEEQPAPGPAGEQYGDTVSRLSAAID